MASEIPSTVAPSDSASTSGRKNKPGKRERQARKSQVSAPVGQPASQSKAAMFASGGGEPTPQPGRYPIVFQTGAGEPSRDQLFSLELSALSDVVTSFFSNYVKNPKFAEFRAHAGTTNAEFNKMISVSFFLRLAQQLVHAHVNVGLPQGDYSNVSSTDVRVTGAVAAAVGQYGEFTVPALGTRFLFSDYDSTVIRLIWAAKEIDRGRAVSDVIGRLWLPTHASDGFTKLYVAQMLSDFLLTVDLQIPVSVLKDAVLSGTVPDAWENIKGALGAPPSPGQPDRRDRFDFIFKSQRDAPHFVQDWTEARATTVLTELGLEWNDPGPDQVNWSIPYKQLFTELSLKWAQLNAAYAQFFEMSSGLANRSAAGGSQAQMADVTTTDQITVLKTHLALSAAQFSLAACFPPECIFEGGLPRRVVLTTPVSVSQRTAEFCQQDWR
uniref:Capsid protein n=1 Tax=Erysiphe necator associated gammapartitivirus 2 TaxID=2742541 RepID=A0A8E3YYU1_9VIRU|nr:capsid protein [Erysiphe necator associated gammapartitivirus 2]